MTSLRLVAVDRTPQAFAAVIRSALAESADRSVSIEPTDNFATALRDLLPDGASASAADADIVCLTQGEPAALDAALLRQIDRRAGTVVMPRLAGHGLDRPLFLISIPKAGTHLLYRLAAALGFRPGIVCPDDPSPGYWYCIEYSNSHTVPRDFFVDSVRRAPYGNRSHPFLRAPALFVVRHPLDILLSEAAYYGKPGNAAFAGWYDGLDLAGCIARLIDDQFLLGRFTDRLRAFAPWIAFPNVITVPFEDLVGPAGGGDADWQRSLIWSVQLRLGAPGSTDHIAAQLFDRDSPTFRDGQIGSHRRSLPDALRADVVRQVEPALASFGYASDGELRSGLAQAWRRRPLRIEAVDFDATPILVQPEYLGHSLVRYRRRFYGVPAARGEIDLTALPPAELAALPNAGRLELLRRIIDEAPLLLRIAAAEEALTQRAREMRALEATLDERTQRLAALESGMAERTQRLAALEAGMTERTQRLAALEAGMTERTQRLAALETVMTERTQRLAALETEQARRRESLMQVWKRIVSGSGKAK